MPVSIPIEFDCRGHSLIGILEEADAASSRGVIIIVGGPQYRVGSHRQFVLLSRQLALAGFTTMRFDHRGIGDSDGDTTFEQIGPDIAAAINAFFTKYPDLTEIVLWGLCDAASAILMFAPTDPRVSGLVVLNPWIRSEHTLAQSYLSKYYVSRLMQADFWRQLISGRVRVARSVRELLHNLRLAKFPPASANDNIAADSEDWPESQFQGQMLQGLRAFSGNTLFILSGQDITANEFKIYIKNDRNRRRLLKRKTIRVMDFPEADHTFSTAGWREQVAAWTVDWIRSW